MGITSFYLVLLGYCLVFLVFFRVSWSFDEIFPSIVRLAQVFLTSFAEFYRVLLGFTGFYLVLPSLTGFYLVLLGFT